MSEIKLSDWVAQKLSDEGIEHVFMVTGGGSMHLNQSLGSHPKLECIFNHHEQACAVAAEGYYRVNNRLAVVNVTSGPGGTNAITGVYGAFTDSIGMIVISGQVKYETTVRSTGLPLRQYGDQELDIEKLITPITKFSAMVTDPYSIRYCLEKALYLARTGRPGPCWIDIPLDIQGARIDPDKLEGFDPREFEDHQSNRDLSADCDAVLEKIAKSKRPVIYAGNGINLSGQQNAFLQLADKLGIPVVTGFSAHDVIWSEHPCYVGRPGTIGDRAGNFVVQNSDCILILGTRLPLRQISYNWDSFARHAVKIWVDIDGLELDRPNIKADLPIVADLKDFIPALIARSYAGPSAEHQSWLAWSKERQRRYPVVLPEYWNNQVVNPYCFMDSLFAALPEGQIVVAANATACVTSFQAGKIKKGQRLWSNGGCASMGYDLPASIGACVASRGKTIICLAGDGSIMMNLQELQTISSNELPIKIFLLNNNGYVSIFQTHRNFFNGREIGSGPKSGVTFPEFKALSGAFGLPYFRCSNHDDMAEAIGKTLQVEGPAICEIILDENQPFAPKLSSKQLPDGTIVSPELEDMAPFLSRQELSENMLVDDE